MWEAPQKEEIENKPMEQPIETHDPTDEEGQYLEEQEEDDRLER
jgi:hypothetical protein